MNNKKQFLLALALLIVIGATDVYTLSAAAAEQDVNTTPGIITEESSDGDSTRSQEIGWVYKVFGSILYRRPYDVSTGEWLGPWERV